ncbi:MAG: ATP-dependent zinc protease [Flavobacteriales bacterium]|nr:ATP-dependent zinc protease [Flavobacteriales bacterium]
MRRSKKKKVIGRTEYIALPRLGIERVEAKIDTGAYRSALHYHRVKVRRGEKGRELVVSFYMGRKRPTIVFRTFKRVTVKSSTGHKTRRWLVTTTVQLNGHQVRTPFTLFDRSDMKYQVLLGRKFLQGRFVVDVAHKHLQDQ